MKNKNEIPNLSTSSIIVSACLLGINCKYNAGNNRKEEVIKYLSDKFFVPICPEQLGGLPTPRYSSQINGNRVINSQSKDVTENFQKGAEETLKIANLIGSKCAILKQGSPSCGRDIILRKSKKVKGKGRTCELLEKKGFTIFSEEDFSGSFD